LTQNDDIIGADTHIICENIEEAFRAIGNLQRGRRNNDGAIGNKIAL